MKKIFLIIILLIGVGYFLLPTKKTLLVTQKIYTTNNIAFKVLIQKGGWEKWWPNYKKTKKSDIYFYKGFSFEITHRTNSAINILIKSETNTESVITFNNLEDGLIKVNWVAQILYPKNPIKRMIANNQPEKITVAITGLLKHLKLYLENEDKVYGIPIRLGKITDTVMLATKLVLPYYPSNKQVYESIAQLKKQIKNQNAQQTNVEMLNITAIDKKNFQVTIAIPINKTIKPSAKTFINKMIVGNVLVSQVKGGRKTIENAFVQMKNYCNAHKLTSPAMPFQILLTNRMLQPDSTKWLTKINYPIY